MSIPSKYYKILQNKLSNKDLFLEAEKRSLWTSHLELALFSFLEIVVRTLKVQGNFSDITDGAVNKAMDVLSVLLSGELKPRLSVVTAESLWYSGHWNMVFHVVIQRRVGEWVNSVFSNKFKKCRLEGSSGMVHS